MRIDSHQHFWQYNPVDFAWIDDSMTHIRRSFGPEDLKPLLDENNFDGCVLVQVNQTEDETVHFNKIAEENDFVKGVVGWTDLFSDRLEEKLTEYTALKKVKGFRHIVQGEPVGFMKNPDFVSGIKKLVKHDFTYDILIFPKQLKDALFLVRKCPDNRFVLDHLAKPEIRAGKISQWASYINELAKNPNLYCKISGMVTEADYHNWKKEDFYIYMDIVLNEFDIDRVMYGSDWPVCTVAADYSEQLDIVESYFEQLSGNEKAKVFGENAVKFYNLEN